MKIILKNLGILWFLAISCDIYGQGTFQNLNFEAANIAGYAPGSQNVPVTNALPGWTAYFGAPSFGITNTLTEVGYDGVSLGGATISINDTNTGGSFVPFQGQFSASLKGIFPSQPPPNDYFVALGQVGQIPTNSQSVTLFGTFFSGFQLSFAGQNISLVQMSVASDYAIFGGDISAFAGQTGELLFTALPAKGGYLDNIQFSTSPIPEPTTFSLFALGGLLIGCRQWRKSKR